MSGKRGGARPGAGRKPVHDEQRVRDLAIKAIVAVHGTEDAGFEWLLRSQEPSLAKWVYEHAYGKPKEQIDLNSKVEQTIIIDVDDDEDMEDDETDNVEETTDDERYDKESELLDDEDDE